ncbi:hypothetical protein BHE74_00001622 [Ensete ventricosum]|uniref:Auxin-responsive protein n=1 Tax=Ensete ventricosum TaxID=4639 RepID=A0A426YT03_ENSVE|nr:hypothetical protein B296_00039133 [Ensete ventricosum]RWV90826.1 hypothetical protein GW17_00046941 [Ensete ventricosum]RWW89425.1 hypothetical protein BHE74_00001622 [Ensete ventricosum]
MSPPLEHDYIGLSELHCTAAAAASVGIGGGGAEDGVLNLKDTELRLGLPGSQPAERKDEVGLTLGLLPKVFVSGAKRGFSDTIDGAGKWGLAAGGGGSEVEGGKGGALFSPRGENGGGGLLPGHGNAGKDVVAKAAGQERKAAAQAGNSAGSDPHLMMSKNWNRAQVVGWPPIRSYRKNTMATNPSKNKEDADGKQGLGCLYVKVSMDGAPYLRKVDLKTYNNYNDFSVALEKMFSGFTIGQCGSHGIPSRDGLSESRLMDFLSGSEYVLTYEDKDGDWMLVGDVPWE